MTNTGPEYRTLQLVASNGVSVDREPHTELLHKEPQVRLATNNGELVGEASAQSEVAPKTDATEPKNEA